MATVSRGNMKHDKRYIIQKTYSTVIQNDDEARKVLHVLKGNESQADVKRRQNRIMKITKITAFCLIVFLILLFIFYPTGW
jgi:hypothetical protein